MKRLIAFAAIACIAATPPDPPKLWPGPTTFAAQAHLRRLNVPYLRRVAAAGFDAVRISLVPWWAQHPDGSWDWTNYDAMYKWLRARDMTPLFMLQNPRDEADVEPLIDFAHEAAERYPSALFELGNEPDNPEQWPEFYPPHAAKRLTPQAYWAIAKRLARALRQGNSHARIATAGTSGMDLAWQKALVAEIRTDGAFADGTIAALGVHAYGEQPPRKHARRNDIVHDLATLKAMLPDGIEVWITEFGLVDPSAEDVREWFSAMSALGVPLFSWYEAQDDSLGAQTFRYGLVDEAGTPKPAYDAARAYLRARAKPSATP